MTPAHDLTRDAEAALEFDRVKALVGRFARTGPGRRMAAGVRPARSPAGVSRWLAMVDELGRWMEGGKGFPLAGACDVKPLVAAARDRGAPLDGKELRALRACLEAARALRRTFQPHADAMPALWSLLGALPGDGGLIERIGEAVDTGGKVVGPPGGELSTIRRRLEVARERAYRRAEQMCRSPEWRGMLREKAPALRNDRMVLVVRAECRGQVRGIFHDRSASGATVYIEPESLVELQNEIQDLVRAEQREVHRILRDLTQAVLEQRDVLVRTENLLAAADFTHARVLFAHAYGARVPRIVEAEPLRLRGARHPLLMEMAMRGASERGVLDGQERLEKAWSEVVPFDLDLGDRFDVLVVTGPNTGGKTVFLKTTGLIVSMALCGIPVPCDRGARVPFFRGVVADIGDEQNLQQSLSTFSSHMKRIAEILGKADPRTLVLLDELGAGTDPAEGEALGWAILQELVSRGVPVLVTTHLGRLKEFAAATRRAENGSVEFDPISLRPTYRLTIGLPGESNALTIARTLGLPAGILQEAERRLRAGKGQAAELVESVQRMRRTVQERLEEAESETEALRRRREDLERRIAEAESKAKLATAEADRSLESRLSWARTQLSRVLREIGTAPSHLAPRLALLEQIIEEQLRASPLAEKRRRYLKTVRRDERVWLPKYRESCRVRRIDFDAEQVQVTYRNMLVTVAFDDVACPADTPADGA